jgi:hypothetical protein
MMQSFCEVKLKSITPSRGRAVTDIGRHIESQEKFHHLFIGVNGAVLAAAMQTVKFETLGKYGILFELTAWLCLAVSLIISIYNAWKMQDLFYAAVETEIAGERLKQPRAEGDWGSSVAVFVTKVFESIYKKFELLAGGFRNRFRYQIIFFTVGIFGVGIARSIAGIMRIKALWSHSA